MTAFWRGLPGEGLFYGIRPGSFQMVWNLGKGWSWNGMLSAVHDDMVSRWIMSEGFIFNKNLENCVKDYRVRGLCPGIISRMISLLI